MSTVISKRKGFYERNNFLTNSIPILKKEIDHYDTLITVGAPFENVKAGFELKKYYPKIKWILILFDLYTYSMSGNNHANSEEKLAEEIEWMESADFVIMQPDMVKRISETPLERFSGKMYSMEIPSLKFGDKLPDSWMKTQNDVINIVYTGMFYSNIRNPEFMLRFFSEICNKDSRVVLHIVGYGCGDIVNKYKAVMKDNLVLHGSLDKEAADNILKQGDILLNIGNSDSSVIPSKIMEYIGSCKPIINFYSIDNDTCKKRLEQYPLRINIKQGDISQTSIESLMDFIWSNKGTRCQRELIEKLYEDYSAKCFVDKMLSLAYRE